MEGGGTGMEGEQSKRLPLFVVERGRTWSNEFFKIVGFAGKRFLTSLSLLAFFFALAPIFAPLKSEKCFAPKETLATQVNSSSV